LMDQFMLLALFLFVIAVHELSHAVFAAGRLRGVFAGFVRVSGRWFIDFLFFSVGLVVYPPRKSDAVVPQFSVLAVLVLLMLVGVVPSLGVVAGVVLNLALGVLDFRNLVLMDRFRDLPWETLKELTARKLYGRIFWLR